jgi:import receptor subunit TOM20
MTAEIGRLFFTFFLFMTNKYFFGTILAAAIGYGFYFDYQRRNNAEFRKNLQKQKKEAAKIKSQQKKTTKEPQMLIPDEPIPENNEGREQYFMKNLQAGEMLMQQGPPAFDAAATCFYRALKVYPEPQKLLEVLAQSLPEVILNLIIQKMSEDVRAAQEGGLNIVEEIE